MKTKQSRLQELKKYEVDIELLNVRTAAPFTEHHAEEAKHGAG